MLNLPVESRFIQKHSPFKDWNWDKEIQSQILHSLDVFITVYLNAHKKKGKQPIKSPEILQPDYVLDAKKQLKKDKIGDIKEKQKVLAEIFEKRNNKVNKLEKNINGA